MGLQKHFNAELVQQKYILTWKNGVKMGLQKHSNAELDQQKYILTIINLLCSKLISMKLQF